MAYEDFGAYERLLSEEGVEAIKSLRPYFMSEATAREALQQRGFDQQVSLLERAAHVLDPNSMGLGVFFDNHVRNTEAFMFGGLWATRLVVECLPVSTIEEARHYKFSIERNPVHGDPVQNQKVLVNTTQSEARAGYALAANYHPEIEPRIDDWWTNPEEQGFVRDGFGFAFHIVQQAVIRIGHFDGATMAIDIRMLRNVDYDWDADFKTVVEPHNEA